MLRLLLLLCVVSFPLTAQTYTRANRNDSTLLITRAVQCQKVSTCPDSVEVLWEYGRDTRIRHVFKAKGTDTVVVKRGLTGDLTATPYYGEYRRTKGAPITVYSMPVDTVIDCHYGPGLLKPCERNIEIAPGDTMRRTVKFVLANGMKIAPLSPFGFQIDTAFFRVRKSAKGDTVWLVAR